MGSGIVLCVLCCSFRYMVRMRVDGPFDRRRIALPSHERIAEKGAILRSMPQVRPRHGSSLRVAQYMYRQAHVRALLLSEHERGSGCDDRIGSIRAPSHFMDRRGSCRRKIRFRHGLQGRARHIHCPRHDSCIRVCITLAFSYIPSHSGHRHLRVARSETRASAGCQDASKSPGSGERKSKKEAKGQRGKRAEGKQTKRQCRERTWHRHDSDVIFGPYCDVISYTMLLSYFASPSVRVLFYIQSILLCTLNTFTIITQLHINNYKQYYVFCTTYSREPFSNSFLCFMG